VAAARRSPAGVDGRTGIRESEPVDNRVLSRLNAPRLNAFLGEVRDACRAPGGDWSWSRNQPGVWEVDDEGLVRAGQAASLSSFWICDWRLVTIRSARPRAGG
jgi:hypothetical protein